jgi:hypothetical protein
MSLRLINTRTMGMKVFMGEDVPPYAILSHTWAEEEISLQEYEGLLGDATHSSRQKSGFKKM